MTEHELLSGDRVDVVCFTESELVAVEVKSRDSNWQDLRRGVYQCVKYRAVLCAQEASQREVRCVLVDRVAVSGGFGPSRKEARHRTPLRQRPWSLIVRARRAWIASPARVCRGAHRRAVGSIWEPLTDWPIEVFVR